MLRKIKGYDLFACEPQFHARCRKEYTSKPTSVNIDFESKSRQSEMELAHADAFKEVCLIVDDRLINGNLSAIVLSMSAELSSYASRTREPLSIEDLYTNED